MGHEPLSLVYSNAEAQQMCLSDLSGDTAIRQSSGNRSLLSLTAA
jgi:hypothetical protein